MFPAYKFFVKQLVLPLQATVWGEQPDVLDQSLTTPTRFIRALCVHCCKCWYLHRVLSSKYYSSIIVIQ